VSVSIADAISFFRLSCGRWRSQRTSHHLLHRRAEAGGSLIEVVEVAADDPRLLAIATLHGQEPDQLVGGCQVRWSGSMAWDKAGEDHQGESVFGLIPTDARGREGLLLRDRGYAESSPVAGHFRMDDRDGLLLTTAYETMSSLERFWFPSPDREAAHQHRRRPLEHGLVLRRKPLQHRAIPRCRGQRPRAPRLGGQPPVGLWLVSRERYGL